MDEDARQFEGHQHDRQTDEEAEEDGHPIGRQSHLLGQERRDQGGNRHRQHDFHVPPPPQNRLNASPMRPSQLVRHQPVTRP